ncbi:MAG: cytochrome c oxidase subunit II [Omnitrophica WOR_2 bacterium]|jgi:cytochrome c oxidase subunit 2
MYSGASNLVVTTDNAFFLIIGISAVFFFGILGTIIWFLIKYNKKKHPVAEQIHGSNALEIAWTVIPLIIVLIMFFYGWSGYSPARDAPKDAMQIRAVARMWSWSFQYSNGVKTDTLYIPIDKAVVLDLQSVDVVHSLYIPAFRIKEDLVPGRTNKMWFIGEKVGSYELFCAEYCGLSHSYMYTEVKVLDQKDYDKWMASVSDTTALAKSAANPAAAGKKLTELNGCIACHSSDGTKLVGPSFKGIYGTKQKVETNGKSREVTVDDAYIKNSIYNPDADVVEGFKKGQMTSFKEQLKDQDIQQIIEYIKSLK